MRTNRKNASQIGMRLEGCSESGLVGTKLKVEPMLISSNFLDPELNLNHFMELKQIGLVWVLSSRSSFSIIVWFFHSLIKKDSISYLDFF